MGLRRNRSDIIGRDPRVFLANMPGIVLTGIRLDKETPDLSKQEKYALHFLSKTTPVLDIMALIKNVLYGR